MTRSSKEERMLAFLEGRMDEEERERLLREVESDPSMAEELRVAASGLEAVHDLTAFRAQAAGSAPADAPTRSAPWRIAASVAATLLIAVPATWQLATSRTDAASTPVSDSSTFQVATGQPREPEASFVLVLHGRWPDEGAVSPAEGRSRAEEYWAWTSQLADDGILLAAGDLRWEPGRRLAPGARLVEVDAGELEDPGFVVGMFAVRVSSYEEAMALARDCPHLRYGGSVSVRQVNAGFVSTGLADWDDS